MLKAILLLLLVCKKSIMKMIMSKSILVQLELQLLQQLQFLKHQLQKLSWNIGNTKVGMDHMLINMLKASVLLQRKLLKETLWCSTSKKSFKLNIHIFQLTPIKPKIGDFIQQMKVLLQSILISLAKMANN